MVDTTPPTWNVTPTNQVWEYGDPFSYQVNASDYFTITFSLNDTSNFSIGSSTGLIVGLYPNDTSRTPLAVYSINITATDASGNNLSAAITITNQDTTHPTWDQTPPNITHEYYTPLLYKVNATDLLLSVYSINDTTNFKINAATGLIENNTLLPVGNLSFIVFVNDTTGNTLNATVFIETLDTTPPTWNQTPQGFGFIYGRNVTYQVNASDPSGLDVYSLSDSSNFTINS
ncbi:unnamed protein product, partial [marine sediment metagenome]